MPQPQWLDKPDGAGFYFVSAPEYGLMVASVHRVGPADRTGNYIAYFIPSPLQVACYDGVWQPDDLEPKIDGWRWQRLYEPATLPGMAEQATRTAEPVRFLARSEMAVTQGD